MICISIIRCTVNVVQRLEFFFFVIVYSAVAQSFNKKIIITITFDKFDVISLLLATNMMMLFFFYSFHTYGRLKYKNIFQKKTWPCLNTTLYHSINLDPLTHRYGSFRKYWIYWLLFYCLWKKIKMEVKKIEE